MSRRNFSSVVLAALAVGLLAPAVVAEEGKPASKSKLEEPEYVGIAYRVDPKDNSLQSLERQTYGLQTKTKGMGFGGSRASYEVQGLASPIRFPAGEPQKFVIKLTSAGADPSSVLRLVPLAPTAAGKKAAKTGAGGSRQAVMMDQKGLFGDVNLDPTMGALPILAKPFGESSLEFKAEGELKPGEYAILLPGSMTAFCFGLDAAPAK